METMKQYYKTLIFIAIGSLLGYGYYYYFGCTSGCTIKSNELYMTLYGAVFGLIIGFPSKKKSKEDNNNIEAEESEND